MDKSIECASKIYSLMSDGLSRRIFINRLDFYLTNDKQFIQFSNGNYNKIFALEPEEDNYGKTSSALYNVKGLTLLRKGAWSQEGTLSFSSNDQGSRIISSGEQSIETTSIDALAGDVAVTFIKMDVEGAELEALKGAEKTIRLRKPRLAICVYHKPEDILAIPEYILSLNPEYKFYMRHYGFDRMYWETVLYAL